MENNYAFGNYITELRKKKKLSQAELGEKLGVSNKAVSKWENGAAYPSTDLILPLAEALGVSVEEILASISQSKQEKTRLRRFLDTVLGCEKLIYIVLGSIWIIVYALFLIFGEQPDKRFEAVFAPIGTAFLFGGIWLAFFVSGKGAMRSMKVIDVYEAFALAVFTWGFIALLVTFILNMKTGYNMSVSMVPGALAGLTFFHNRRKR
ncbi:MAG: helix-turn-helix transcriptional regulator [Clostridia bacterium]|nr:helix-turn-helix transcriptional regulator [Clostridia bacterium]